MPWTSITSVGIAKVEFLEQVTHLLNPTIKAAKKKKTELTSKHYLELSLISHITMHETLKGLLFT